MRIALALVVLVACGDNASPCDYTEVDDVGNATAGEPTGLAVGIATRSVCGEVDHGHFDAAAKSVDVDTYRVTVEGSGELLVEISGDDSLSVLDSFSVRLFDTAANPTLLAAGRLDTMLGEHAAFLAEVPAGTYDVVVAGDATGDPSGSIGYRVRISADPSAKCPALDGAAVYTEANDGAANTANDMIDVDYTKDPAFTATAATDDAPEPTGITTVSGLSYKLGGSSAMVSHADEYLDRDTFELATDEDSNELAVRLDWDGDATDLDFAVLEKDTLRVAGIGNIASTSQRELQVFAVKPNTTYWLWVGAFKGSMPAAFGATVCATHYFR